MNQTNIAPLAAGLLMLALLSAGCSQSNRTEGRLDASTQLTSTQAVGDVVRGGDITGEELQGKATTMLNDARVYCLGILLYAEKHNNMVPTNLSQTLPYLHADGRTPRGTNHFNLLYHGSLSKLRNPMTNGIILIRSDSWRGKDGKWMRIYGFADGHCEVHSEPDDHFAAWEKQHSLHP